MANRKWQVSAPCLALVIVGGGLWFGSGRGGHRPGERMVDKQLLDLEKQLGHKVFAPTWLPRGGKMGPRGAKTGAHRVQQDFYDGRDEPMMVLSQERRSADRDKYNQRIFERRAESTTEINGKPAYFVTGPGGERRLFWQDDTTSLIVSSTMLDDEELAKVARRIQ